MLDVNNMMLISLVLMRISGFVLFNPIFGRRNVPGIARAGLIMVLTMVIFTSIPQATVAANTTIEYAVLLLKEFALGYIIGTVVNLVFFVVTFGGEIIDLQLGMSMAKIFDIQSNTSLSTSASFYNALFMMLFFAADGHLAMIHTILTSGQVVPIGSFTLGQNLSTGILDVFTQCSILGLKFAFPIIAVELLAEVGVGILMKTIPQINVFSVNVQAKILIGLLMLFLLFAPMSQFLDKLVVIMIDTIHGILSML